MPLSKNIVNEIRAIPEGVVFDYSFFNVPKSAELALAKTLSRLVEANTIERVAKGKYYKPRNTAFGQLKPAEDEIIKAVTQKAGKITGYLTGQALYNRMGLTTQVPNIITIATNQVLPPKQIGAYKIKYSKRKAQITEKNIPLLQLLDALKDITTIPDAEVNSSFLLLLNRIKGLQPDEKKQLVKEVEFYNPATRALTGALFEQYIPGFNINFLRNSLNPLSKYKIGISEGTLSNKSNWNIV